MVKTTGIPFCDSKAKQRSCSSAGTSLGAGRRAPNACATLKRSNPFSRQNGSWREEVVSYLPLVKKVAFEIRRNLPPHVEEEELIGNGVIGLIDATAKFDPAKRVNFKVYARHRIRGAILDALRKEDRASRSLRVKIRKAESASHALEARLGRPATSPEIASELGMELEEWHKTAAEARRATLAPACLEEKPEGKRSPSESLAAPRREDPFMLCYRSEQKEIMADALNCLEEREREMIRLYYFGSRTMKQIGASLGVDESRVSQLHSRAVGRLRDCVQAMLSRPRLSPSTPRQSAE
jgi:RNA polymerase sigma factor FliA